MGEREFIDAHQYGTPHVKRECVRRGNSAAPRPGCIDAEGRIGSSRCRLVNGYLKNEGTDEEVFKGGRCVVTTELETDACKYMRHDNLWDVRYVNDRKVSTVNPYHGQVQPARARARPTPRTELHSKQPLCNQHAVAVQTGKRQPTPRT